MPARISQADLKDLLSRESMNFLKHQFQILLMKILISKFLIFTPPARYISESFMKALKAFNKTFRGPTKKWENKNLRYFSLFVRDRDGKG